MDRPAPAQVGSLELELEDAPEPLAVPEDLPRRFLVYLSGTDTFGSAATRARSDVNILAAVDTQAKKLLLVATPRDFTSPSRRRGARGISWPTRVSTGWRPRRRPWRACTA